MQAIESPALSAILVPFKSYLDRIQGEKLIGAHSLLSTAFNGIDAPARAKPRLDACGNVLGHRFNVESMDRKGRDYLVADLSALMDAIDSVVALLALPAHVAREDDAKMAGRIIPKPMALKAGIQAIHALGRACAVVDLIDSTDNQANRSQSWGALRDGTAMEALVSLRDDYTGTMLVVSSKCGECDMYIASPYEVAESLALMKRNALHTIHWCGLFDKPTDATAPVVVRLPAPAPKEWKVAANAATVDAPVIVHAVGHDPELCNVIPFPVKPAPIDPTPYATSAVRSLLGHPSCYHPPAGSTIVHNGPGCIEDRYTLVIPPQRDRAGLAWDGESAMAVDHCGLWSHKFGIGLYWDNLRPLVTGPALDAMRTLALAKRAADNKARQDAEAARLAEEADALARGEALWQSLGLDGVKAFIVAEYRQDQSDITTDYFASSTTKRVVLATSTHTRQLFPEMRKAAALWHETAHMATEGREHRENYSMGRGTYLGGSYSHATGWNIRKVFAYRGEVEALKRDLARHGGPLVAAVQAPAPVSLDGGPAIVEPTATSSPVVESTSPVQAPQLAPGTPVVWTRGKRQGQTGTVRAIRPDGRLVIESGDKIHGEAHGITPDNVKAV